MSFPLSGLFIRIISFQKFLKKIKLSNTSADNRQASGTGRILLFEWKFKSFRY